MDKKNERNKNPVLSAKAVKKSPRIGKINLQEEKFFAYEKQKSHN